MPSSSSVARDRHTSPPRLAHRSSQLLRAEGAESNLVPAAGALLDAFERVFLFGRSEGAAVAARYHHPTLHAKLSGLLLSGWGCEFTYMWSCAEHAKLCGGQCSTALPVLAIVGETDAYFGATGSVAADVAAASNGYGSSSLTGNCRASLNSQGFSRSTTVVFRGTGHSIMYKNDNALRSVLSDFLAAPASAAERPAWSSLSRSDCSFASGVFTCDEIQDADPCVGYKPNTAAPWQNLGAPACPSPPTALTASNAAVISGTASGAVVMLLGILVAIKCGATSKVAARPADIDV